MQKVIGSFERHIDSVPYAAKVTLQIDKEAAESSIVIECNGDGWLALDMKVTATRDGFDYWKQGALVGCQYGLKLCGNPKCTIIIKRIEALTIDTSPSIIAGAAIDAIWKAFEYKPSIETSVHIETVIFNSQKLPENAIPSFDDGNMLEN